MNQIRALVTVIKYDFDEKLTIRTRKILTDIGIISEFVKISSNDLRKIFKKSLLDPGRFLCEIYRSITGNYFEEEQDKKFYDCNERLVLSAIAFLYLPEAIIELHRRLPIGKKNDPPKKAFPRVILRQQSAKSPYLKSQLEEYNWILCKNKQSIKKKGELTAQPRVILPPSHLVLKSNQWKQLSEANLKKRTSQVNHEKTRSYSTRNRSLQLRPIHSNNDQKKESNKNETSVAKISIENDKEDDVQFPEEFEKNKSNGPDTFESTKNEFIALENKRSYLRGRKYSLSHWEESLRNIDEDFVIMSKKANCILKNVYKTTRMVFNVDFCSNCCIQKPKIRTKMKETSISLIDSLILDGNRKRIFIGSLTLNSPPGSLPISETSLLKKEEITLSEERLIKKNIICGSIITDGKTINLIEGILKDQLRFEYKIPHLSKRIKNVLPCNCNCNRAKENKDDEDHSMMKIDNLQCQDCYNNMNLSLKKFIEASKARKNMEKQTVEQIDHTSCTQRFFNDTKHVKEKEPETCAKCIHSPDKCKKSAFDKIKKDGIKFSISGIKQMVYDNAESCQQIISKVILFTPTLLTPKSSKSDVTQVSSLNQFNHWSKIKLNDNCHPVNNDGKKRLVGYHDRVAKIITDYKNRVNEEMMKLYKQVEELDYIKNKLRENLETMKIDLPKIDSKHVIKKRSTKQIATEDNDMKSTTKSSRMKKVVDIDDNNEIDNEKAGEDDKKIMDFDKNTNDEKLSKSNDDLMALMKMALREMANENFLLAKLPECDKIPQLRMWIKYRQGLAPSFIEKDELCNKIQNIYNEQSDDSTKIIAPQINLDKSQETLNYSDLKKLDNYVKLKKKLFYTKVRKLRVNKSRLAWNQLQFNNFLSNLSFKSAYFIYQPAKEADGHMLKPYGFHSPVKKKKI